MTRRGRCITFLVATFSISLACAAELPPVSRVQRSRTLEYDRTVPIPTRLTPDDDLVRVVKNTFPPLIAHNVAATLEAAVQLASLHDVIVVVNGLTRSGTLIEGGTWIRSFVTGSVIDLVKPGKGLELQARQVTFWHDDGEMVIGRVLVRAGTYPVYSSQKKYLLMLGHDESRGLYPSMSHEVNSEGILTPIERSDGEIPRRSTALYDQPLAVVVSKLRDRLSK